MGDSNTQSIFLERIKKQLPANVSFADNLAEILNISRDSAYRRIRGETVISLDEVKKLCQHYDVSLDALMSPSSSVSFRHWAVNNSDFTLENWLTSIHTNLTLIAAHPQSEMIYSAKDIPIFNYFNYPELSAFKMFFWMKAVLRYPKYQDKKFILEIMPKEHLLLGKRIWEKYANISTTELWSDEAVGATLKQIEFCFDSGFFSNPADAKLLCEQFGTLINNIREWAAVGNKSQGQSTKFSLYKNEILIGDNVVLFKSGEIKTAFIAYNTMSVLLTSQEYFCRHIEEYMKNLLNSSVLISTTGEKERNMFFNAIDKKIENTKRKVV